MDLRTSSGDLARFPRNPTHGGVTQRGGAVNAKMAGDASNVR